MAASTSDVHAFSLRVYLLLQTVVSDIVIHSRSHFKSSSSDSRESDDDKDDVNLNIPKFSCVANGAKYHLHTYALIQTLLYHLGPKALSSVAPANSESPQGSLMGLTEHAGTRWTVLSRKDVAKALPPLKIKLPGAAAGRRGKKTKK